MAFSQEIGQGSAVDRILAAEFRIAIDAAAHGRHPLLGRARVQKRGGSAQHGFREPAQW